MQLSGFARAASPAGRLSFGFHLTWGGRPLNSCSALLRIHKKCRGGAMTSGRGVARALRAAYLALHRQTDDCFAKDGVTADQFVLLAALAEADAVTQQELVRHVGSDPNTVRAMLLLLEGRGLVAREP